MIPELLNREDEMLARMEQRLTPRQREAHDALWLEIMRSFK
jgi:hypothetical protein